MSLAAHFTQYPFHTWPLGVIYLLIIMPLAAQFYQNPLFIPDPLGSHVYWLLCPCRHNLPLSSGFESRILRIIGFHGWYNSNIVGANGIRPPMIQVHFPIIGMTCSTVRLPNAIMFQYKFTRFHLVLNQDLQDFQDCRERLRFSAMVIRRRLLFTLLFAAA